jgi:hypothetical protein
MNTRRNSSDDSQLSDAIKSLQNLLDDVKTGRNITADKSDAPLQDRDDTGVAAGSQMEQTDEFPAFTGNQDAGATEMEETVEFAAAAETGALPVLDDDKTEVDIDSHFDMNIPPALPEDSEEEEQPEDFIPTLSETIVNGEIPVLKEIVQLPDGSMIPEPQDIDLETALQSDDLPTPVSDAAEAAADAIQIILARYHSKPMTPEIREQLMHVVTEFLVNSPELEIPDSIV